MLQHIHQVEKQPTLRADRASHAATEVQPRDSRHSSSYHRLNQSTVVNAPSLCTFSVCVCVLVSGLVFTMLGRIVNRCIACKFLTKCSFNVSTGIESTGEKERCESRAMPRVSNEIRYSTLRQWRDKAVPSRSRDCGRPHRFALPCLTTVSCGPRESSGGCSSPLGGYLHSLHAQADRPTEAVNVLL